MGLDPSTWHRLSEVDREARTALCSQCGPVRIKVKTDGKVCCRKLHRSYDSNGSAGKKRDTEPRACWGCGRPWHPTRGQEHRGIGECAECRQAASWDQRVSLPPMAFTEPPVGTLVYFIQQVGGGPIKIGTTVDLDRRFADLQANSPVPLRTLGTIPGGRQLEAALHYRFRDARLHGEWFQPSPEILGLLESEAVAA